MILLKNLFSFSQMFKEFGRDLTVIGKDADALEDYVRSASPITPILDKRLILVS